MCAAKESGFDLRNPSGRVEEALAIYTRNLIRYTLDGLARRFEERDVLPAFGKPASETVLRSAPLVCARSGVGVGGTGVGVVVGPGVGEGEVVGEEQPE